MYERVRRGITDALFLLTPKLKVRYLGWLGYGNLGDEALYEAIHQLFRETTAFYYRSYMSRVLSFMPNARFDAVFLGGGTLINHLPTYLDLFRAVNADARVVFGTGVADPAFTDSLGAPYTTLSGWTECLKEAHYVGVRGPHSARLLREWGVAREVRVVGDPALYFAVDEPHRGSGRVIGINLGTTSNKLWGGDDERLLQDVTRELQTLADRGWSIRFFPVIASDVATMRKVMEALPAERCFLVEYGGDAQTFVEAVRLVDVFVGEKLHSVVLAVCGGVPSVMLEYHPKCRDFMASIDREAFVVRTDTVGPRSIVERVETLASGTDSEHRAWLEVARGYRERLLGEALIVSRKLEDSKSCRRGPTFRSH